MSERLEDETMASDAARALESTAPSPPLTPELQDALTSVELPLSGEAGASLDAQDGVYALEFDLMFRERLVAALDAAGPSVAMEERVLAALKGAASSPELGVEPGVAAAETAGYLESLPISPGPEPSVPQHLVEEPPPAHLAAEHEAEPAHLQGAASPVAAAEPVPLAPSVAPAASAAPDAAVDQHAAPAERVAWYRKRFLLIFEQERRSLSIAAAALGALIVVGVARAVVGTMFGGSSSASVVAPLASGAAQVQTVAESETAYEDEAVPSQAQPNASRLAVAYPEVRLSTGETLEVVVNDSRPEAVDPVTVGEFVETATAYGADAKYPCDVFRIIVQSEGDGSLYAISFADDGSFYLARPR